MMKIYCTVCDKLLRNPFDAVDYISCSHCLFKYQYYKSLFICEKNFRFSFIQKSKILTISYFSYLISIYSTLENRFNDNIIFQVKTINPPIKNFNKKEIEFVMNKYLKLSTFS